MIELVVTFFLIVWVAIAILSPSPDIENNYDKEM